MTGEHIKKGDGDWEYPDRDELEKKCGLFSIETYIERRRGTLRKYLEKKKENLIREAIAFGLHYGNTNKKLWWEQKWINKREMGILKMSWNK